MVIFKILCQILKIIFYNNNNNCNNNTKQIKITTTIILSKLCNNKEIIMNKPQATRQKIRTEALYISMT